MNTWKRHGSGNRPDVPGVVPRQTRLSTSDGLRESGNLNNSMISNNENENASFLEEDMGVHGRGVSSLHGKVSSRMMPTANDFSAVSHMQNIKGQNMNSLHATDPPERDSTSAHVLRNDEVQRDLKADHLVTDSQARFLFARTRSSPELTDAYGDVSSQLRKKNIDSESSVSISCTVVEDVSSVHVASQPSVDAASDSNNGSNSYRRDLHLDGFSEEFSSAQVMHNEEQDLVNMMASASLQSFNGQLHGQFNLNSAHMPFSIPPSYIASMAYAQRNLPGYVPTDTPLIDPSFTNMQFPQGMVSPQFTHYFPSIGVNSPSQTPFDQSSENFGSMEMKSEELDSDFWQERNVGTSSGFDPENGNIDMIQPEDKSSSISGLKYVPPPRVSSTGSASRVQQKHTKEKRGSLRQNSDTFPIQDDRSSEVYSEERSVSSRFSSAAHSNSLRSRTSSESSWDGSSVKTPKSVKEKRGKKIAPTNIATGHGKGKTMSEHVPNQAEEDDQEWGSLSNMGTELVERNPSLEPITAVQVPRHHLPGFEVAQTSGSESVIPFPPMLIDPGSRQRTNDNSRLVAFYPTGPPIPFLTMLPVYNVPPETGTSDQSSGRFEGESAENNESGQNFISDGYGHSDDLNASTVFRGTTAVETSENKKSDILNSDFLSHWQNLQLGRYCQNPRNHGPLLYPSSPVMVPPAYLQGRFPYENPGRPFPTNTNLFSQLMTSYGHRLVPVAPIQSVSSRSPSVYQHYVDDLPRYRSGTGTYLPNPVRILFKMTVRLFSVHFHPILECIRVMPVLECKLHNNLRYD